jgi:hypothetical protein
MPNKRNHKLERMPSRAHRDYLERCRLRLEEQRQEKGDLVMSRPMAPVIEAAIPGTLPNAGSNMRTPTLRWPVQVCRSCAFCTTPA